MSKLIDKEAFSVCSSSRELIRKGLESAGLSNALGTFLHLLTCAKQAYPGLLQGYSISRKGQESQR